MNNVKQDGWVESETDKAIGKRDKPTKVEDDVVRGELQYSDKSSEDSDNRGMDVSGMQRKKQACKRMWKYEQMIWRTWKVVYEQDSLC